MTTPETPDQLGFEASPDGIEAALDIAVQNLLAVDEIKRNLDTLRYQTSEEVRQHRVEEQARAAGLTESARLIEWVLDRAIPLVDNGSSWGSEVGRRRQQANAARDSMLTRPE
jgi:hypothetical protein